MSWQLTQFQTPLLKKDVICWQKYVFPLVSFQYCRRGQFLQIKICFNLSEICFHSGENVFIDKRMYHSRGNHVSITRKNNFTWRIMCWGKQHLQVKRFTSTTVRNSCYRLNFMFSSVGNMLPLPGKIVFRDKSTCFHQWRLCIHNCEKLFYL